MTYQETKCGDYLKTYAQGRNEKRDNNAEIDAAPTASTSNMAQQHGCTFKDQVQHFFSAILTLSCLGLIFFAVGVGYAALPGHPAIHVPLLIAVVVLLAYLEGLQVAILGLERVDGENFREVAPRGYATHKLSVGNNGLNVQRFLVGRQFFVVFVVFLCAQLTTFPTLPKDNVPDWLFILVIETGLPGALVVLSFGQLMPQLIAASYPVKFMNLPGAYSVLMLCLGFESIGVTHFSWLLTAINVKLFNLKEDMWIPPVDDFEMGTGNNGQEKKTFDSFRRFDFAKKEADDQTDRLSNGRLLEWGFVRSNMNVPYYPALNVEIDVKNGAAAGQTTLSAADTFEWLQKASSGFRAHTLYEKADGDHNSNLPTPKDMCHFLLSKKQAVPRYLLPPHHPQHIPPHIVAFDLLSRQEEAQRTATENLNELERVRAEMQAIKLDNIKPDGLEEVL